MQPDGLPDSRRQGWVVGHFGPAAKLPSAADAAAKQQANTTNNNTDCVMITNDNPTRSFFAALDLGPGGPAAVLEVDQDDGSMVRRPVLVAVTVLCCACAVTDWYLQSNAVPVPTSVGTKTSTSFPPAFLRALPPPPSPQCRIAWSLHRAAQCFVPIGGDCAVTVCCDCVLCLWSTSRCSMLRADWRNFGAFVVSKL